MNSTHESFYGRPSKKNGGPRLCKVKVYRENFDAQTLLYTRNTQYASESFLRYKNKYIKVYKVRWILGGRIKYA